MDELEIRVFDEIKNYKEKIYFLNIRQWIFFILIVALVVPTYIFLKDKIGEEVTSYIVIAIAGVLGFIGFVKIHELPAEKIIPYWIRHIFFFSKPITYITDKEYSEKKKKVRDKSMPKKKKKNKEKLKKENKKTKKENKNEIILEKAKKKYEKTSKKTVEKNKKVKRKNKNKSKEDELNKKLSKLSKEQQEALLKLLGK